MTCLLFQILHLAEQVVIGFVSGIHNAFVISRFEVQRCERCRTGLATTSSAAFCGATDFADVVCLWLFVSPAGRGLVRRSATNATSLYGATLCLWPKQYADVFHRIFKLASVD